MRNFRYFQTEKEVDKIKHRYIRLKVIAINWVYFIAIGLSALIMYFYGYGIYEILDVILAPIVIFIFIFISIVVGKEYINFIELAMYLTVVGFFLIAVSLILEVKTPGIFISILVAYLITMFYREFKVIMFANIFMIMFNILAFKEINTIISDLVNTEGLIVSIQFLVFYLIFLVTINTYTSEKENRRLYYDIAKIKESEIRNQNIIISLFNKTNDYNVNVDYFKKAKEICKQLSTKYNLNDIDNKLDLIEAITNNDKTVSKEEYAKYFDISLSDYSQLKRLAMKLSQYNNLEYKNKKMPIKDLYESINKTEDDLEIKIIAFSVFYVMLRIDKPYLKALSDDEIYDIIVDSNYSGNIDHRILGAYQENCNVINEIINDNL